MTMNILIHSAEILLIYFLLMCHENFGLDIPEQSTATSSYMYTSEELPNYTDTVIFNYSDYVTIKSEIFSYAEWVVMMRAGRMINMKKLMLEYSTICPIQQSCGVDFEKRYLFSGNVKNVPAFKDCKECQCGRQCVEEGDCCPGSYFGYFPHVCTNVLLYPKTEKLAYYTVGECLDEFKDNTTLVAMCESEIRPCTSQDSGLVYKNQFCAQCNADRNCISWRLDVKCAFEEYMNESGLDSYSDVKAAMDKYHCKILYEKAENTDLGSPWCDRFDYLGTVLTDRCNVTGLWRQYDADIDWACNNFIISYKNFKNVFCYICNPSHGNLESGNSIDICQFNDEITEISSACETFPTSERLQPFKNIYCYACNFGHTLLKNSRTNVSFLSDVSESNDPVSLRTKLFLSIVFPHKSNVFDVKGFIREFLNKKYQCENKITKREVTKDFHFENIEDINNLFETVCGNSLFCNNDRKDNMTYSNPVCRNCSCDEDCAENEICCLDTTILKQPYTCVNSKEFPIFRKQKNHGDQENRRFFEVWTDNKTYKLIDTCLNEANVSSGKCSAFVNTSNLFDYVPIGTGAKNSYRNIFYYECNNKRAKPITIDFQAYCSTFIENDLYTNLTKFLNAIMKHFHTISFIPLKTKTCVNSYDALSKSYIGGEHFERVVEHPTKLPQKIVREENVLYSHLYDSVKTVYSSCNMTGYQKDSNDLLENLCESKSTTILSLPEYSVYHKVYKNFACFLCNPEFFPPDFPTHLLITCPVNSSLEWYEENMILKELCIKTQRDDVWFPFKNLYCAECNLPPWQLIYVKVHIYDMLSPPFYKYLFSLSPDDFNKIDKASSEEDGEIECVNGTYDYNMKQCRSLYCDEGNRLYKSACTPLFETATNHLYVMNLSLYINKIHPTDSSKKDSEKDIIVDFDSLCGNISQIIVNHFDETTQFYIQEQQCIASSPCIATPNTANCLNISYTEFIKMYLIIHIEYTESISHVRRLLISALSRNNCIENLTDMNGNLYSVELQPVQDNRMYLPDIGRACLVGLSSDKEMDGILPTMYRVDKFLQCPFVKININDTIVSNKTLTISVKDKNLSFSKGDYQLRHDNVIICMDDFNTKSKNSDNENLLKIDDESKYIALNTFTQTCTIISLVCLFITFVTYCLFPSLRTIPGCSLMLLCFSLFFAQTFLQFGLNGKSETIFCIVTGVLIHYFWIASFCAMNICSFHMFKVFYFSDLSNQMPQNKINLFVKYLLYVIFFPIIFVLVAISINVFHSDVSSVGYGTNFCFISDFFIFVGTFLTPACVICLSNFVFFSLAFHKIRTTPDVQSNQNKNNFFIFLKLSIIVGVTWPLLIFDNIFVEIWFSFMASGINSLQGVFILSSFILNKRVFYLYKSMFKKSVDTKSVSISELSTTYSIINKTRG